MSDALSFISAFVKESSDDARYQPPRLPRKPAEVGARAIKRKLGCDGPGPVAEQLEMVAFLPEEEQADAAVGILQSAMHAQDQDEACGRNCIVF